MNTPLKQNLDMTGRFTEVHTGRVLLGRLSADGDLITELASLCAGQSISLASFAVYGAVSSITWGVYDPAQQVYVTRTETSPHQIAVCTGNISLKSGEPFVQAQGVFCNLDGRCFGGRVFSETRLIVGEYELTEWRPSRLERDYDPETGMILWQFIP